MADADNPASKGMPETCPHCSHSMADHVVQLTGQPDTATTGLMTCPEPDCDCSITIRFRREAPAEGEAGAAE